MPCKRKKRNKKDGSEMRFNYSSCESSSPEYDEENLDDEEEPLQFSKHERDNRLKDKNHYSNGNGNRRKTPGESAFINSNRYGLVWN